MRSRVGTCLPHVLMEDGDKKGRCGIAPLALNSKAADSAPAGQAGDVSEPASACPQPALSLRGMGVRAAVFP